MPHPHSQHGYSAEVRLDLLVDGNTYSLCEIGPDGVRLRKPIELPPCEADVVMHVDDHQEVWRVWLPDGVSPSDTFVRTEQLARVA